MGAVYDALLEVSPDRDGELRNASDQIAALPRSKSRLRVPFWRINTLLENRRVAAVLHQLGQQDPAQDVDV